MKIAEYFETIKDHLLIVSFVTGFKILKQVDRSKNGHLRAHAILSDNSQLEFSEFVEQSAKEEIQLATYSYHWSDEKDNLIRRWDNTPHFPKLEIFPHHIHLSEDNVIPGELTNIFTVLDEIAKIIEQRKV